jgi:hypothetical protein
VRACLRAPYLWHTRGREGARGPGKWLRVREIDLKMVVNDPWREPQRGMKLGGLFGAARADSCRS